MRRSLTLSAATVLVAAGLQVAGSTAADAAATCTYRPVLPSRIAVNQSVVGLRAQLAISGPAACRSGLSVSTHLVHGTDDNFLWWTDTQPLSETIYAYSVVPGVYRTTASDCMSYDADFNQFSCSVSGAATMIKFGGRATLAAKRTGKKVTLTARTGRFEAFSGSAATSTRISIQRLSGRTWKTIKKATTRGTKGYSWTFTKKASARYRVVAAENGVAFAATSRSVKR